MKKFGTPELDRILQRLDELTVHFFGLFGEGDRRVAFTGRDAFREDNEEIYTDLLAALELIGSHLKLLQNPPEEIIPLFRRTQELQRGLALPDGRGRREFRLLGGEARSRLLPAGHAHRCFAASLPKSCSTRWIRRC